MGNEAGFDEQRNRLRWATKLASISDEVEGGHSYSRLKDYFTPYHSFFPRFFRKFAKRILSSPFNPKDKQHD